jgi:phage terminase large subunit
MFMLKYDGAQGAIVRKLRTTMDGTVLATFRRVLGKDTQVHAYGGEHPDWFDYPNGSRVYVGGMDNPQKVLSSERDVIYVNQAEELTLDDWETLTTRATGRGAVMPFTQVFGDCNPGPATHWILNRPSLRVLYSKHEDNPTLYDDQGNQTVQGERTMTVLDNLTGVRFKRLRQGLWVGAEGMVYEQWDRSVHIVPDEQLVEWGILTKEGKPNSETLQLVFAAVDWGFTNPGSIGVWAVDSDGRAYLLREWYMSGHTIDWWIATAQEACEEWGVEFFVCDPSEPAYIEQFNQADLSAMKAQNDIAPGIQVFQKRLKVKADGRARFYVRSGAMQERDWQRDAAHQPCGLVEEIDGYVWAVPKDGTASKEEPQKHNDHAMDMARYAVMYIDRMFGDGATVFLS